LPAAAAASDLSSGSETFQQQHLNAPISQVGAFLRAWRSGRIPKPPALTPPALTPPALTPPALTPPAPDPPNQAEAGARPSISGAMFLTEPGAV